jgi:hypothetical protein
MAMSRSLDRARCLVRGRGAAVLVEHLDLSAFDQLLECGALEGVVVDLPFSPRSEMEGPALVQGDLDRSPCLVDDGSDGRFS